LTSYLTKKGSSNEMTKAIITMMLNVTGLLKPISGAITNPKITAGTTIRNETKNLEVELIECFLPQFRQSTGLYELQIENNISFHPNLLLHTLHFCKNFSPYGPDESISILS
jgi:hypothetical protein